MKMKKLISILVTVFMCFQLTSCNINNNSNNGESNFKETNNSIDKEVEKNIPDYLIESIAENRDFNNDLNEFSKDEFEKFLYKYESFEDEPSIDDIEWCDGGTKYNITVYEAVEDVNFLFNMLKYSYAGYEYFGGDEAFLKAKENIIQNLNNSKNEIKVSELDQIIRYNLYFIQDAHFAINYGSTVKRYKYLCNNEMILYRDEEGIYSNINDEKYYVISVNDSDYKDYIKLSLDKEGNIIYTFGLMDTCERKSINVLFKSSDKKIEKEIILSYKPFLYYSRDVGYSKYEVEGIPVIENRRMYRSSNDDNELENYLKDAESFKNKDILIMDIRGNVGGTSIYTKGWFEKFTGRKPYISHIGSGLTTAVNYKLFLNNWKFNSFETQKDEMIKKDQEILNKISIGDILEGWSDIYFDEVQKVGTDTLVVVLTDNRIASCGEEMVEYLRQLDNAIFIGINTGGCMLINNNVPWYLPNSKMKIFSGTGISLNHDLKNIDGRGYYPDLWVNSDDIIDRVIKFLGKYDMKAIRIQ